LRGPTNWERCDRPPPSLGDLDEDEDHFEAYVRWRVAIVDDAAAQALTLMTGDGLADEGSRWLDAHARA